ncbi:MAG: hypothetical protein AAGG07_12275 [Planctomycetota bacterium]
MLMLTLTVDPALFGSAEEADRYMRERRVIGRLIQDLWRWRYLHSRRYFSISEWQKDTEQTHFHILVDASFIPKADLDRAWDKNRPETAPPREPNRPGFGMTRISKRDFRDAVHAARYATKYLMKVPKHGWPKWVLNSGVDRRLMRYTVSKGFWNRKKPDDPRYRLSFRRLFPRTYLRRLTECGVTVNLFEVLDFGRGVEPRKAYHWIGRLDIDEDILADLRDRLPAAGKRGVDLFTDSLATAVARLSQAAGRDVAFLSARGMGRRRA